MTTVSTFAVTRTNDGTIRVYDASVSVEFRTGLGIHFTGIDGFPAREILLRTIKALAASGCIVGNRRITADVDLGATINVKERYSMLTELFDFPLAVAIMNELGFAKFDTSLRTRYVGSLCPDGRIEVLGDAVYFACHDRVFMGSELVCANTIFADCKVDPGHVYLNTFRRTFNLELTEKNGGK